MNWPIVKLSSVAKISSGQSAPKETEFNQNKGLPFIRAGHLEGLIEGSLALQSLPKIDSERAKFHRLKILPAGTIVFAKSGMSATLNRVYILPEDAYYVSHLASIQTDQDRLLNSYCLYFLKKYKPSRLIKDAAYPSIGLSTVENIQIPLPPLETQKRISEILDTADALRKKDQELLAKYDELAQAVFIDMFGEVRSNPKGYEKVALKDLLIENEKISYGIVQPGKEVSNGVPVIRVGDFNELNVSMEDIKNVSSEVEAKHMKTRLIGDEILIACVGSIGKIALVHDAVKGFNIVRATARVRVEPNIINRLFLAYYLLQPHIQNYFVTETRTVSQPTLNIHHIEMTSILLPPLFLQNAFANKIHLIHCSKKKLKNQLSNELFNTILNKYFNVN